jgi:hypothetical protein
MSNYPDWRYFPAYAEPPTWTSGLVGVFAANQKAIGSRVIHEKPLESDDVLAALAADLESEMGFEVEKDKTAKGKLPRPVFFGDQGSFLRTYFIDAFQGEHGIALEIEAGRATAGNAIYRDLIQASLMLDARFLALAVPFEYRYGIKKTTKEPCYSKTYSVVEAIYGSPRLELPFEGLLLIGY